MRVVISKGIIQASQNLRVGLASEDKYNAELAQMRVVLIAYAFSQQVVTTFISFPYILWTRLMRAGVAPWIPS